MALSTMIVSRDWQEVSVFECILGGLHIDVDVEAEPQRAWTRMAKTKVDAVIVDCDLEGSEGLLQRLQSGECQNSNPVVIVSGSGGGNHVEAGSAEFVVNKPVSVEQAVHTLSAARNMILEGRLRYHREALDVLVSLTTDSKSEHTAHLLNLSQGGLRVRLRPVSALKGRVGINFMLPGSSSPLQARGEVAWTDERGNAGIRFVELSQPAKRDLQLWLERHYFQSPAN